MRYGIFNTESGNLIEAYSDQHSALAFVGDMLRDDAGAIDYIALVVEHEGSSQVLAGEALRAAVFGTSDADASVVAV